MDMLSWSGRRTDVKQTSQAEGNRCSRFRHALSKVGEKEGEQEGGKEKRSNVEKRGGKEKTVKR